MAESFVTGAPIYLQIAQRFKQDIACGALGPGEKVVPVRELALLLGVNPNTMQRALAELEREGLLYSERTAGRYVTSDTGLIQSLRQTMARDTADGYVKALWALNYRGEDIIQLTREALGKEDRNL